MLFAEVDLTVRTFNGVCRAERVFAVVAGRRMAGTVLVATLAAFSAIFVTNNVITLRASRRI